MRCKEIHSLFSLIVICNKRSEIRQRWKFTMLSVYWMFWGFDSRLVALTELKNLFLSLNICWLIFKSLLDFCHHFQPIYNGNRTEWSPIQSVIIQVIENIGWLQGGSPICQSWVWLQREFNVNKSCYQLIIIVITSENNKYI